MVPIHITVEDVNDNAPQFVQPLYTASVPEDLALGETILTGECVSVSFGFILALQSTPLTPILV